MSMRIFGVKCLFGVLAATSVVRADMFTFQPTPADLFDLDHLKYYKWGIDWVLPSNHSITSASLLFDDIDNWQVETDILYITIRNNAPVGVSVHTDNQGGGNNFPNNDNNDPLGTYTDPHDNGTPEDLIVQIPSTYFAWLSDGNFGFGFDPDCHYWNNGIMLTIQTNSDDELLPAPGAAFLGMMGMGLLCWSRRGMRI